MLVLSRKQDERILIGDEIELRIVAIQGSRVRLGISCPKHVRILRSELAQEFGLAPLGPSSGAIKSFESEELHPPAVPATR